MGYIYAELTLSNPTRPELKPIAVRALCDSGAISSCLPEHVANQLEISTTETREVYTADGSLHRVPYAGPLHMKFDNRQCFAGVFVMGDEVLLGAIQMQDMDVVLDLRKEQLTVNPNSPNMATGKVKGNVRRAR